MSEEKARLSAERVERVKARIAISDRIPILEKLLLENMRRDAGALKALLDEVNKTNTYEHLLYRFYHTSFKVHRIQQETQRIVEALTRISPEGLPFCNYFQTILNSGTGINWKQEDNQHWVERTAPMVAAFFHARYFLEMAVKYAADLEAPPQMLPYGWAALLSLFGIR